jgi:hypothetical protein
VPLLLKCQIFLLRDDFLPGRAPALTLMRVKVDHC